LLLERYDETCDEFPPCGHDHPPSPLGCGTPCIVGLDAVAVDVRRSEQANLIGRRLTGISLCNRVAANERADWHTLESHFGVRREASNHRTEVPRADSIVEPANVRIQDGYRLDTCHCRTSLAAAGWPVECEAGGYAEEVV